VAADDPRCLSSAGTLHRIRWPLQPRSHDLRTALRRVRKPLDDALTSPWAFSRSRSVMSEAIRDGDSPLRPSAYPRRVTVMGRGDLGLRSLVPAALFGARLTSFFETRRRLPTSATAYDVRARTSSSRDPRRDGRRDALPFLTPHASSLAGMVRRGETRKVRSRRPRCRLCLAFTRRSRPRYRLERATSERVAPPDSLVATDLHGSEDRAKDVSTAGA
jgi:hypothetical protein